MISMSVSIIFLTSGLCIFTAIFWPVLRVAFCTWLMDADAIGFLSKSWNNCSSFFPNSFSTMSLASLKENEGTMSWSFSNSTEYSLWTKSGLTLSTCPNLMNVGPSFSNILLSLTSGLVSSFFFNFDFRILASGTWCLSPILVNRKSNPSSNRTESIWLNLFMSLTSFIICNGIMLIAFYFISLTAQLSYSLLAPAFILKMHGTLYECTLLTS